MVRSDCKKAMLGCRKAKLENTSRLPANSSVMQVTMSRLGFEVM